MSGPVRFRLDGKVVEALGDETIWQAAKRHGVVIPHLCHRDEADYRPDGNCRACVVEIGGERVLAPSCLRRPTPGMEVFVESERARHARRMVLELLLTDQPERAFAHDTDSMFWRWIDDAGLKDSRFPRRDPPAPDLSHPAMAVHLDACIHCTLCVRACREVQVNDVIGMAGRGSRTKVVFDFDDPMGDSTCVACGECVQSCPTGALMPANLLDADGVKTAAADRTVDSLCPYCGVGCQLTYHIRGDTIIAVNGRDGTANRNRLCVKGRFGFDYVNHPHRLTRPLIRRDGVKKDPHETPDPGNPLCHFREASWEEALDRAAAGLRSIRDRDGGASLAGFGSAKGSNEEAYLFQKFVRTGFGTNNVDHCTRLCHASSVAALMEGIGSGAVTAPFTAAADADVIVVIGARPAQNHPVAATFIKNAVKRGATLIVMDPRRQELSRYAQHMLQFKPGTDVALLSAMIHTIIDENLVDEQYIAGFTEGFEELKQRVLAFAPEAMASVCGIDAETIRTVSRVYATAKRSILFWGMGVSQHVHGTDNARCLIALALITGHIGRPGTGLHPLRGQNNVQGASDAGLIPMVYPDYKSVEDPKTRKVYEDFWGTKLDSKRGLTVVEVINAARAGSIKGMYIMGENPAMSDPDANHAREGLAALELLVVQDIFLTETAALADVVLPASAFPEKTGTFTNTNRQVQLARQALPLPGDTRQDWWIIQEIARRLGLDWRYTHPRDVFSEMRAVMPSTRGITWDRLEREGSVTYPCEAENEPGKAIIFGGGFPTSNGRGKLVPVDLTPPDEVPDERFPLVLTTGRMLEHWHTGAITRRAKLLDTMEPLATASLNPKQLAALGIKAGDTVTLSTRRGTIEVQVRADRDVPPGMVFMPFCYTEAAANILTNPQLDPFGKIPEFKYCAARIEPVARARRDQIGSI
ncbi:MAG: formate dehydrogenase subunit alpha [Rhodospirillales bacterium]|nr:formate dehydrogenase subunit alpha [Rhodospirillales bacterium]